MNKGCGAGGGRKGLAGTLLAEFPRTIQAAGGGGGGGGGGTAKTKPLLLLNIQFN